MTPEEQRIAIAEACGWTVDKDLKGFLGERGTFTQIIPDYLNDLNAMHEAVACLRPKVANLWADELTKITSFGANPHWTHWYHLANATAAQRAEAFLRTLGKWKP